jgi:hypothetical protein
VQEIQPVFLLRAAILPKHARATAIMQAFFTANQ